MEQKSHITMPNGELHTSYSTELVSLT